MERRPSDISKTALVLIDLLNEYLSPKGKIHPAIKDELERVHFVKNVSRLVRGARAANLLIVYVSHELSPTVFDKFEYIHPRFELGLERQVFWEGDYGSDFFEPLRPFEGDVIASRHRLFNGFHGTNLDELLKGRGIQKLVLAGLTAHTCVEGTGREALELGYHLTFLSDAVAEFTQEAHEMAVAISFPTFGFEVLSVDVFLRGLHEPR